MMDPTTAAIEAATAERDRLRRLLCHDHSPRCSALSRDVPCDCGWNAPNLPTNYGEQLEAERDRLRAEVEVQFEKGYDQAVREIRDHFAGGGRREIAVEIDDLWRPGKANRDA